VSKDLKADVAAARKNWQTLAVMRTAWASSLKPLGACLLAVMLCAGLALPAHAITANTSVIPSAVTVTKETAYRGVFGGGAEAHTGLFGADDPVDGSDPTGKAVYFVSRHFQGAMKSAAYLADFGHGYLLFTDSSDSGYNNPFWTHQNIVDTYSWHPSSWSYNPDDPNDQPGISGRVWEKHPADTDPGMLSATYLVTTSASDQSKLQSYISSWIAQARCGRDWGAPIADPHIPGNEIGSPHVAPASDSVYYSLKGQNCVWWSTIMLKQSGIYVRPDVYDAIKDFNHGIGYASQVVSGARNAAEAGRAIPIEVIDVIQDTALGL
jgi:hypothetical protein